MYRSQSPTNAPCYFASVPSSNCEDVENVCAVKNYNDKQTSLADQARNFQEIRALQFFLTPKRRRLRTTKMMDDQSHKPSVNQSPPRPAKDAISSEPVSSLLLRPCHICHRRPTTRVVLDGYTDCEDCEKRTCFICTRECENEECRHVEWEEGSRLAAGSDYDHRPRLRRRRICSSCSVETISCGGQDMVTCLDCHLLTSDLKVFVDQAVHKR